MNLTDRIIHFSVKFNFITHLCIFSVFNEICFSCFNFQNKIIQLIKNENNFQIFTRCRKFRIATKLRISLLPAYIYIFSLLQTYHITLINPSFARSILSAILDSNETPRRG